jgi:hypothetical protein
MSEKKRHIEQDKYYIRKYFISNGEIPITEILLAQTWYEIGAITFIMYNFGINAVVELGADQGGLGVLFALQSFIGKNIRYLGVELYDAHVHPKFLELVNLFPTASFLCADVFSDSCIDHVTNFIQEGRALIYCDNGNKPKEFETYAKCLKPGDLLMVHDYPNEFNEDNSDFSILKQLYIECLSLTRIVLFEKE